MGKHTTELTPVKELPYFDTLRIILEPYKPADNEADADKTFTTAALIQAIEEHYGVPQGPIGKDVEQWVWSQDFVRAMHYLGFKEANVGGLQLEWLVKNHRTR